MSNTDRGAAAAQEADKRYTLYRYNDFGQVMERDRRETTGGANNVLVFEWDGADRLREVKRQGNSVFSATYAPDGERVRKTDSQTGQHLYSHGLHDTFGDTKYTPGMAMRTGPAGKQVDRVFHGDWLGSTRNLTDGTGKKTTSGMRYDGYGAVTAWSGTDGAYPAEQQWAGAWGYQREAPGGPRLGLDYLYQRYYDTDAGRFISRDPIGFGGGLNLYGYVGNDPVNGVDPSGLRPLTRRDQSRLDALAGLNGTRPDGTPPGEQAAFDAAVGAAITQIKAAIAGVPTGGSDPVRLKALWWAIDHLGDSKYGEDSAFTNHFTEPLSPGTFKCNIFAANAYAIGGGIGWGGTGVPWNTTPFGKKYPYGANTLANPAATVPNFPIRRGPSVGDIVAFGSTGRHGHSGLYLGGGAVIYAGRSGVNSFTVGFFSRTHTNTAYRGYSPGQ